MFRLNVWKETSWKAFIIIIKIRSTLQPNRKWRVYKYLRAYYVHYVPLNNMIPPASGIGDRVSYFVCITITEWRTTSSWIYNEGYRNTVTFSF